MRQCHLVVISVTNGQPDKNTAMVAIGGTVRFDNNDNTDYLVRLTDQKKHAAVDVLLPTVGSVSFMTDPEAKPKDEVADFDLLQATTPNSSKGTIVASGGGGKIIIGPSAPTPAPKKSR